MAEKIILELEKTTSTQDAAREISKKEPKKDFMILAQTQSKGYGRDRSLWVSKKGGLYATIALKRKMEPKDSLHLSLKTAQIISSILENLKIKNKIKHPNDIMATHQGKEKKICGILIETIPYKNERRILIGIGLNINNPTPSYATSLKELSKKDFHIRKLAELLFESISGNI